MTDTDAVRRFAGLDDSMHASMLELLVYRCGFAIADTSPIQNGVNITLMGGAVVSVFKTGKFTCANKEVLDKITAALGYKP